MMGTKARKPTGETMAKAKGRRLREMSLDEQITYYQNKASRLKKKHAEQQKLHHENVGRIFEKVFGQVSGTDEEIEKVFESMLENLAAYLNQLKQNENGEANTT